MIIGGQVLAVDVLEIKEGKVYLQIVRQATEFLPVGFQREFCGWHIASVEQPEIDIRSSDVPVFYLRGGCTHRNHSVVSCPWELWGSLMQAIESVNVKLYVACQLEEEFFERVAS